MRVAAGGVGYLCVAGRPVRHPELVRRRGNLDIELRAEVRVRRIGGLAVLKDEPRRHADYERGSSRHGDDGDSGSSVRN